MTTVDPRPTNLAGPRHLVAGTYRQRVEQVVVALVLIPYAVVVVLCLGAAASLGVLAGVGALFAYVGVLVAWPTARRWARWSWHRCRWWFDARAVGLALNAERGVFRADAGADDDEHRVVAPFLRRLELTPTGRTYTVRPLPGQTPATFADATSRMATRWNAAAVEVRHVPGDRFVHVLVVKGLPPVARWER